MKPRTVFQLLPQGWMFSWKMSLVYTWDHTYFEPKVWVARYAWDLAWLFTRQRITKKLTGRERSSDRVTQWQSEAVTERSSDRVNSVHYNTRKRLCHFPSNKGLPEILEYHPEFLGDIPEMYLRLPEILTSLLRVVSPGKCPKSPNSQ